MLKKLLVRETKKWGLLKQVAHDLLVPLQWIFLAALLSEKRHSTAMGNLLDIADALCSRCP
jgi:hypothetical protein